MHDALNWWLFVPIGLVVAAFIYGVRCVWNNTK